MLPIPGTSSVEHLEQNVAGAALHLPDELYEELAAVNPPHAVLRG
jgi:aryl-alcohol dehydrogenase-like predicted oxidoreductase